MLNAAPGTSVKLSDPTKVLYPELSYELVGASYCVFNEIGFGMSEKLYQKAYEAELEKRKIPFQREKMVVQMYDNRPLARYFLDFVVDDKIVVEIKVRARLGYVHIKQVLEYLKITGLKLAIIIYFTRDGIKYRRVLDAGVSV